MQRREAEAEVARLNTELEERVALRTAQLAGANQELEHSNRELQATNRDLEGFSYSISHDLRGALRVIDGLSRILGEEYGDVIDQQGRDYVTRICAGTVRMGGLIDSLLALSRVGRSDLRPQNFDLSSAASDVAAELAGLYGERQVEVVVAEGATAFVDPALARTILWNLFGNAWKFTDGVADARVEFRVEEVSDRASAGPSAAEIVFSVRDNGPGFAHEDCERIFEAFERLDAAAKVEGSGIGLATVKRAVERLGGQVWAESKTDAGAEFFVSFPREGVAHAAA